MSAERALLRRLVALIPSDLCCRDFHHSKADRHDGSDCPIEKRIDVALTDARALLAEPEGEDAIWDATLMDGLSNDPPPDHDAFVAAQKYARASIRAALDKRRKAKQRSRAEAEAMVEELDDSAYALGAAEERDDHVTAAVQRKRATTAHAALLAALTGEEK